MVGKRDNFGKLGVILATAGSAVGLGNIWRFPYMTGQDGGAAFLIIYIICVCLLGIPGMVAEFIVGRHGASNAVRAYRKVGGSRHWSVIGYMGIICSMIILGFYAVVAGWCLQYLYASFAGELNGDSEYVSHYFRNLSSSAVLPALWAVAFITMTHVVVTRGVRNGIEKSARMLMPLLILLLIVIVIASCSLPDAIDGIRFLFYPDFSKMTKGVMLDALGQAFFSLSLGTACLCTYASYFSRSTNLLKSSAQIAVLDTVIAILAGLMIFPAAASVGVSPDSGPSLIFVTLPNVFSEAFASVPVVGYIVGFSFYSLLSLAALTSTISMHEIATAFFTEEFRLSRRWGAAIVTVVCSVIAVFCSLSVGANKNISIMGIPLLDFCDNLTALVLMPLGAFLTCIFIGWVVPSRIVRDEFTNWGMVPTVLYHVWRFSVRIICPICIGIIFLRQLGVVTF